MYSITAPSMLYPKPMEMTLKITRLALVAIFMFGLVFGFGFISDAHAQTEATGEACESPAFLIRGLEVEETASSGDRARRLATQKAIGKAWEELINRLVLADQNITVLTEVVASDMLKFTRIDSETVLSRRYIATLDFCFDREAVRRVFTQHRIAHAELTSERLLLLPVFVAASGRANLWREPNPWRAEMLRVLPDHNGLLDLHIPSGFAFARSVSAEALLDGDKNTLQRMARSDDVPMVIVSTASIASNLLSGPTPFDPNTSNNPDGRGGRGLGSGYEVLVEATLYDQQGNRLSNIQSSRLPLAADQLDEQFAYLARDIIGKIENVWRRANRVDFTDDNLIRLSLTPQSMGEWVTTLDMLESLSPVEGYQVRQLSATSGVVDLVLVGSRDAFDYALGQVGFRLVNNADSGVGGFVLTPVQ